MELELEWSWKKNSGVGVVIRSYGVGVGVELWKTRWSWSGVGVSYPWSCPSLNLSEVQITSVKEAPLQSMKIGLSAAKAAVKFFHKLLLSQSIQLLSTDLINDKKTIINELKVIKHPVNCFSMSDLTANSIFHSKCKIKL